MMATKSPGSITRSMPLSAVTEIRPVLYVLPRWWSWMTGVGAMTDENMAIFLSGDGRQAVTAHQGEGP